MLTPVLLVALVTAVAAGILALVVARGHRRAPPGRMLVITTAQGLKVCERALVVPFVQRAEEIDLSPVTITLERAGREGVRCRDAIRVDVRAVFVVRVNATREDIERVVNTMGCARAADREAVRERFAARFYSALEEVMQAVNFDETARERSRIEEEIVRHLGSDLDGYLLESVALERLAQTPITELDPHDILDAQGIAKITTQNARAREAAAARERETQLVIARQNLEANLQIIELERQRGLAEARKNAEIAEAQRALGGSSGPVAPPDVERVEDDYRRAVREAEEAYRRALGDPKVS